MGFLYYPTDFELMVQGEAKIELTSRNLYRFNIEVDYIDDDSNENDFTICSMVLKDENRRELGEIYSIYRSFKESLPLPVPQRAFIKDITDKFKIELISDLMMTQAVNNPSLIEYELAMFEPADMEIDSDISVQYFPDKGLYFIKLDGYDTEKGSEKSTIEIREFASKIIGRNLENLNFRDKNEAKIFLRGIFKKQFDNILRNL